MSAASDDMSVGTMLQAARERAGIDLRDLADRTKVRPGYLEALEAESFDALPEDVYVRNFLRLYAKAVKIDAHEVLAAYEAARGRQRGRPAAAVAAAATPATTPPDSDDVAPAQAESIVAEPPPPTRTRTKASAAGAGRRAATPPRSSPLRGLSALAPFVVTAVLVAALAGAAIWGFDRLLAGPTPTPAPPTTAVVPSTTGSATTPAAPGGLLADAPAASTLPAGTVLPTETSLTVRTDPPGATVTVDAFPIPGTTPVDDVPVTARDARVVRISLSGYLDVERVVDLTQDVVLSVTLDPDPSLAPPEPDPYPRDAVVIEVREATWLEAYASTARGQGERLAYTTAQPGERYEFQRPVYLHFGNAQGADVYADGVLVESIGSGAAVTGQAFPTR